MERTGETQATIIVLAFPPSESCSNRVSFESRYGTCVAFFVGSPRAEITFPSALRPALIETASLARSPVAAVRFNRSEPARSTKRNFEVTLTQVPPSESCGLAGRPSWLGGLRPTRLPGRSKVGVPLRPAGTGLETRGMAERRRLCWGEGGELGMAGKDGVGGAEPVRLR